jgi:hypothetical protein
LEGRRFDLLDVLVRRIGKIRVLACELRESEHRTERLVELVRDTGCQLSDGCETIRVEELLVETFMFRGRFAAFDDHGDLTRDGVEQATLFLEKRTFVELRSLPR